MFQTKHMATCRVIQYDWDRNLSPLRKKSVAFVSHFVFIYLKNNLRRISKPSAIVLARLGGRIAARHGVVVRRRALTPVLELTVVLRLLLCIDAVLVLLKIVVVACG